MKTLRLVGKLFGISLLILGFNSSCKKDKDEKCITCTYTYEDGSHDTEEICESDMQEWIGDEDMTWDEFESLVRAYAAISDELSCN